VLTGPPCAGKSTFVEEHRGPDDLVVDLDRLAEALGLPADVPAYGSRHVAAAAARTARTAVVRAQQDGEYDGLAGDVWVIDAELTSQVRGIWRRHGAELLDLDPGRDVCHERADAAGRPGATHRLIDDWYDRAERGA
jgi:predicted kinase